MEIRGKGRPARTEAWTDLIHSPRGASKFVVLVTLNSKGKKGSRDVRGNAGWERASSRVVAKAGQTSMGGISRELRSHGQGHGRGGAGDQN